MLTIQVKYDFEILYSFTIYSTQLTALSISTHTYDIFDYRRMFGKCQYLKKMNPNKMKTRVNGKLYCIFTYNTLS